MAALFGHIGEFVEGREQWPQYVERLKHFLAANGITDADRKRDFFFGSDWAECLQAAVQSGGAREAGGEAFTDLVDVMTQHHSPPPSEIVQRYRFHTRFCRQGETVAMYLSELRALAQWCKFGDALDDMLRDRLVCGVNEETIQSRLLAEQGSP